MVKGEWVNRKMGSSFVINGKVGGKVDMLDRMVSSSFVVNREVDSLDRKVGASFVINFKSMSHVLVHV